MKDQFDHQPDPELGAALRAALEPKGQDEQAFLARVMARYDETLERATVPTWEVLASWSGRGIAAAAAVAFIGGLLLGRVTPSPAENADQIASIDSAMAPVDGPGLTALMTAQDPPDASVVLSSMVEPQ